MRHAGGLKPARNWSVLIAALMALGLAVPAAQSSTPEPIVGGDPASPGEYPAQGFLEIESTSFCGGTLVGSRWFLTAAHCAVDDFGIPLPPGSFEVGFGHVDPTQITDIYGVTAVEVNSTYNPATFQNDVAMLKLDRPAPYQFMRVIGTDEAAKWAAGTPARIVGWGTTSSGGPPSPVLLEANVPIVSDSSCVLDYTGHDPPMDPITMVCAGDGVHDTCQGDSGGPLMVPDGSGFVLAGITSWGEGCAEPDFPGVYTRLGASALNAWVTARFPRASLSGPTSAVAGHLTPFTSTSFHPEGVSGFTAFNWDFDNDGAFDDQTGSPTSWRFPGPGVYTVSLEASKPGEDRAVSSGQIVVTPNGPPAANIGGPYRVAEGASIVLRGTGTDPEGHAVSLFWDVDGNGSFESTNPNPPFSAARIDGPASRPVSFRVCDVADACVVASAAISITNARPRANAGANRRTRAGRRLCFRGRASDAGRDRLRVTWRFGNGRTARGLRPCTRYRRPGRYTARMTVRDDDGATATDRLVVRVAKKKR